MRFSWNGGTPIGIDDSRILSVIAAYAASAGSYKCGAADAADEGNLRKMPGRCCGFHPALSRKHDAAPHGLQKAAWESKPLSVGLESSSASSGKA
jgi:hypothetical protein